MHAPQWFPLDEPLQGFDADGELAISRPLC
jgi:ABC-type Mn2+/Zn2+ transport system ATPase subunit